MAEPELPLTRHAMVWVEPDAWSAVLDEHGVGDADPLLAEWAVNRWPLVVRSHACGDPPHLLALGLPLPPSHGKKRFAFRFDAHIVERSERPPLIADAAAIAPAEWRSSLAALVLLDPYTRCFGSLAWELLTGLPYVTAESDIDLLLCVGSAGEADHLGREIARIDIRAPMRLDGEFVTPGGWAVQWREWHSGEEALLVKTREGPQLLSRDRIFA